MIQLFSSNIALIVAEICWSILILEAGLKALSKGELNNRGNDPRYFQEYLGHLFQGESLGIMILNGLHPLSPEVGFFFFCPMSRVWYVREWSRMYGLVGPIILNHLMEKKILCPITLGFDLAIDECKTYRCKRFPVGVMVVQYGTICFVPPSHPHLKVPFWHSVFNQFCESQAFLMSNFCAFLLTAAVFFQFRGSMESPLVRFPSWCELQVPCGN